MEEIDSKKEEKSIHAITGRCDLPIVFTCSLIPIKSAGALVAKFEFK